MGDMNVLIKAIFNQCESGSESGFIVFLAYDFDPKNVNQFQCSNQDNTTAS